ncbi:hypothetical protein chiPu_0030773, partial [Chiloscyllium punctatum]|nr:hypothetical protein [Chiloscyllium punctatum]
PKMAASQVECLEADEEAYATAPQSDPRFVYSEGQRHALEALLDAGPGRYLRCVRREGLRPFLSAEEAARLHGRAQGGGRGEEPPGGRAAEGEAEACSLAYWPLQTDCGAPPLALGWPETGLWKGITRAAVYTHPPPENAPTIKEVVRTSVQNAKQ